MTSGSLPFISLCSKTANLITPLLCTVSGALLNDQHIKTAASTMIHILLCLPNSPKCDHKQYPKHGVHEVPYQSPTLQNFSTCPVCPVCNPIHGSSLSSTRGVTLRDAGMQTVWCSPTQTSSQKPHCCTCCNTHAKAKLDTPNSCLSSCRP